MKSFLTSLMIFSSVLFLAAGQASCADSKNESSAQSGSPHPKEDTPEASQLSGKVIETMNSGAYTYVLLEKNGKKTWVAVPKMRVEKGQNISFLPGAEMVNFESRTLHRTFDRIIFSAGPADKGLANDEVKTTGSKGKAVTSTEKIQVEKAADSNAYTIAEIYTNNESLDKKEVVVKAKVVKVSQGIMGKNWLHIQDGSGSAEKGTQDLVVTTQDDASVGDIITIKGTLYRDKDFGSGYKYAVIIENASIKHQ
jgi:hypothetical protein